LLAQKLSPPSCQGAQELLKLHFRSACLCNEAQRWVICGGKPVYGFALNVANSAGIVATKRFTSGDQFKWRRPLVMGGASKDMGW